MGGDGIDFPSFSLFSELKSTPPAWAGTVARSVEAAVRTSLKSTPPAWAGTSWASVPSSAYMA